MKKDGELYCHNLFDIKRHKMDHTDEMKYRITDGENQNNIIDIIERQGLDGLVWFLKRRIEGYIEEDFLKGFTFN
jgi:hypothetical protein